jgi:hypothetical protein
LEVAIVSILRLSHLSAAFPALGLLHHTCGAFATDMPDTNSYNQPDKDCMKPAQRLPKAGGSRWGFCGAQQLVPLWFAAPAILNL